jgi:DMSO reductase family type II enzyme heme b subunit
MGVLDLVESAPHLLRDPLAEAARVDVAPLYLPAPGGALSGGNAAELEGSGAGATEQREGDLRTVACHTGSEWNVVFVRALAPNDGRAVELAREPLVAAFAIWDAARGDHGAVKSFSIWQRVVLR